MPIWALVLVVVAALALLAFRPIWNWLRFRGDRVIVCPENQRPAGVVVDALHAAASFSNAPDLRLSSCSRWPERAGCGQQCLSQIQESPQDCLVRQILALWYEGRVCAMCQQPFGEIQWVVRKPALLRADKISVEWSEVPAEQLSETLATSLPVCFACHMASTLVRQHPELVVDRSSGSGLAGQPR